MRTRARKRKGRKKKNKKEERQPGTRTEAPEAQERETMNLLATNRDEPTPSERVCVAEGERGRWLTNEEGERVEGRRENDTVRAESERERGGRTWGWFVELSYAAPLAKCAAPHERGYAVFAARKYRVFFFLSGKGSRSPNPSTRVKGLRGPLECFSMLDGRGSRRGWTRCHAFPWCCDRATSFARAWTRLRVPRVLFEKVWQLEVCRVKAWRRVERCSPPNRVATFSRAKKRERERGRLVSFRENRPFPVELTGK